MNKTTLLRIVFFACVFFCGAPMFSGEAPRGLLMATTTSTENTGLLEYLAPEFHKATGINLRWVAVGTGKALELGRNCDADVLLVHAPEAEIAFVTQGYGLERVPFMSNDFILVGPPGDPSGIRSSSSEQALKSISAYGHLFVSRGDRSGTHQLELDLWERAQIPVPDKESWYLQSGQGMLATLRIASERGAYTLTDRGTWIKFESLEHPNTPLIVLVEGDPTLKNIYSVIPVSPDRCPRVNHEAAKRLLEWVTGAEAQRLIAGFRIQGKTLFAPMAAHEQSR